MASSLTNWQNTTAVLTYVFIDHSPRHGSIDWPIDWTRSDTVLCVVVLTYVFIDHSPRHGSIDWPIDWTRSDTVLCVVVLTYVFIDHAQI